MINQGVQGVEFICATPMPRHCTPPLSVVQQPMHSLRTGTDNISALNQVAQPGPAMTMQAPPSGHAPQATRATQATQQHSYEGLNTPTVWRTNQTHAAAKGDASASNVASGGLLYS